MLIFVPLNIISITNVVINHFENHSYIMVKKENLKTFVIQQSDIDKAINYHLDKGGKDHRYLADCLEREMFYSYCWETIHRSVRPWNGFRKILNTVVDSLFCDMPSITIKTIAIDGAITFRTAQCNGVR